MDYYTANMYRRNEYDDEKDDFFWDQNGWDYGSDYEAEHNFPHDEMDEYDSHPIISEKTPKSLAPLPCVQLASVSSGFQTLQQARSFYEKKALAAEEERNKKEMAEKISKEMERKAEEQKWKEILASLPTESRAAKERRLAKEVEQKRKAEEKVRKTKFKIKQKEQQKVVKDREEEKRVVQARRAAHRRERKEEKKKEETNRADFFRKEAEKELEKKELEKKELEKKELEKKELEKKELEKKELEKKEPKIIWWMKRMRRRMRRMRRRMRTVIY
jgi:hypothetical protein